MNRLQLQPRQTISLETSIKILSIHKDNLPLVNQLDPHQAQLQAKNMKNKKIPYGVQNFEDIAEQHYYYVDKTRFIENLESLGEKYLVFMLPRKFGKTLFIDTLSRY